MVRRLLQSAWGSENIDERLWHYDTLTTRQPGAAFAPLHFLSGELFSADIHTVYEQLTLPVWSSHGVCGNSTDYGQEQIVKGRPNWRFSEFPTGAFPHFEVCDRFCREFEDFLCCGRESQGGGDTKREPRQTQWGRRADYVPSGCGHAQVSSACITRDMQPAGRSHIGRQSLGGVLQRSILSGL
jgi:hypothetical protein